MQRHIYNPVQQFNNEAFCAKKDKGMLQPVFCIEG